MVIGSSANRGNMALTTSLPSIARLYMWVLGLGLLGEGLMLRAMGAFRVEAPPLPLPIPLSTADPLHDVIHIIWGMVIVALLIGAPDARVARLALVFGVFYVAFGFLGLFVDRPFGLLLGPEENSFHFTVGPLALMLGWLATRALGRTRAAAVAPEGT